MISRSSFFFKPKNIGSPLEAIIAHRAKNVKSGYFRIRKGSCDEGFVAKPTLVRPKPFESYGGHFSITHGMR